MNRRKVLDVSRRQKPLGKRSSVAALHPNTSAIIHPKSPRPLAPPPLEKGIQHGDAGSCKMSPDPPETHQKPLAPKTKFTSNDRSSEFHCSPRLKSFPAEELRRFDASPRVETTLAPFQMSGDGDILPQHNKMVHQRLVQSSLMNQSSHPEVFNVVPLERSPERQPHRPCVPRPMNHEERMITEHQSEGNFLKKKEPEEMERQPVGGRTAAMFRRHISGPQQNLQAAVIPEERFPQKEQHQQHQRPNHVQFADDPQEIPQEMYYQHYPQQFLQYPQQFPGLGMTSPQDVSMNQSRMYQQQVQPHHQSFNHHQQQGESPWVPHPSLNVSNPRPVQHHHHPQQVLQQPDQTSWSQPGTNPVNYPPITHQHSHHHQQSVQQSQQREYPCQRGPQDEESSKVLQFTPEMIRDQEKLVGILRQQGFPDEIVKRQFDGLLAEQQRQLIFLDQVKNSENSVQASKSTEQPRRKRITRVEEDEKPEWMMHITPPWVSYAALEQQMEKNDGQKSESYQHNEQDQQNLHEQQNMQQEMQQMVNPVVYQQWQQQQQQQMINPNVHHQHQEVPNHPQYHQYHQMAHQNIPEALSHHQQTFHPQNNQELILQDRKARVEPSSLLKEKTYKEVTKRQKQNNGLQDAATVKQAMEALKNPANRTGLEYLVNLEKNEKQIRLNGAQDPEESLLQNWPHRPPDYVIQQSNREERANGLENRRNHDNPPPPIRIQQSSMNEPMPVYPRRVEGDQRFYSMTPVLADNGIHQNCAPAFKNIEDPSQGYNNNFQAHVYNQVQGGASGNHQGLMYSQQRQEYFQEVPKSCLKGSQGDGNGQGQIQGQCYVRGHFDEPRVIGGVKYIGRKSEFIPNSCSSGQY